MVKGGHPHAGGRHQLAFTPMAVAQLSLFPPDDRARTLRPPPPAAVEIIGAADLVDRMDRVVSVGFPHMTFDVVACIEVFWNSRLRSTVGRVHHDRRPALVEISPSYHDAHPDELDETLAHELAHVLHPRAGHGRPWRDELSSALKRLGIPVRQNLVRAAHPAPKNGRYLWRCRGCGNDVDIRPRRRADEIAVRTRCCRRGVDVIDIGSGSVLAPRFFRVVCRRCRVPYVAYDDRSAARRFAQQHRCRCGHALDIVTAA